MATALASMSDCVVSRLAASLLLLRARKCSPCLQDEWASTWIRWKVCMIHGLKCLCGFHSIVGAELFDIQRVEVLKGP